MAPPRGLKRKKAHATRFANGLSSGDGQLSPPDRETWTGWVEVESEPAIFNVMLKDMGVKGIRIQEIFSIDDDGLEMLPRPVHALIFLYQYRVQDETQGTECPPNLGFANQIADGACGTLALLNIVNNIKGLDLGPELQRCKESTMGKNPLERGRTVETFEFVRKIHNSFARETDMLLSDTLARQKALRLKRQRAADKARETRQIKRAAGPTSVQSRRVSKSNSRPRRLPISSQPNDASSDIEEIQDDDYASPSKPTTKAQRLNLEASEVLQAPPHKSTRQRPSTAPTSNRLSPTPHDPENDGDESYHFIALVPMEGQLWKLDGMDRHPLRIGGFDASAPSSWLQVAQPYISTRMAMAPDDGKFNLMAVVADEDAKAELVRDIALLRVLEERERELELESESERSARTPWAEDGIVRGGCEELDVTAAAIEAVVSALKVEDAFTRLTSPLQEMDIKAIRSEITDLKAQQPPLRGRVREQLAREKGEAEEARQRRWDYTRFVKEWVEALVMGPEGNGEGIDDLMELEGK